MIYIGRFTIIAMEKPFILTVSAGVESKIYVEDLQKKIPSAGVIVFISKHFNNKYDFTFSANEALGQNKKGSPKYGPYITLYKYNLADVYVCEKGYGREVKPGESFSLFTWITIFMQIMKSQYSQRTYSWEEVIVMVMDNFKLSV